MFVSVQAMAVALTQAKLIVPVLCTVPNPEPLIVTDDPTTPELGLKLPMTGAGARVNVPAFSVSPPAVVTTTEPVCTGLGVLTPICVSFHEVTVPATPLKVTVPGVVPKPIPYTVTGMFGPDVDGDMVGNQVNGEALLFSLNAVTTTPEVFTGPQPDGIVNVTLVLVHVWAEKMLLPSTVTVPEPDGSKVLPVTVKVVPRRPELGLTLLITGAGASVNVPAFNVVPFARVTTTGPVCTGLGVLPPIWVSDHEVTVPATPLNVSVPAGSLNAAAS